MTLKSVLACYELSKNFFVGSSQSTVIDSVNLSVETDEIIVIIGSSGSGKSIFLHLLGGLEKPTSGTVKMQDKDLKFLSSQERDSIRKNKLGFVYQFHHLLPELSIIENIALPLLIRREPYKEAIAKAFCFLNEVDLCQKPDYMPHQLSGGERQRAAIARALVINPICILADEPTGNLDGKTAEKVFEVMLSLKKKFSTALIIATHDMKIAEKADRLFSLSCGKLLSVR